MLGSRSESRIAIAQGAFERSSVSLRMLPNVGPTFLQRGGDSRAVRLLTRALLGRGGGCPASGSGTSPGAYAVGLTDARVRFVRRHGLVRSGREEVPWEGVDFVQMGRL